MKIRLFLLFLSFISTNAYSQVYYGSFTVGGSSTSYYPVLFSVSGVDGLSSLGKLFVYIGDVHANGSGSGSFHSDIEFISTNWGHMPTKIVEFTYVTGGGSTYNDPIGNIQDGSNEWRGSQLVMWLKGGATYQWSTTLNSRVTLIDGNPEGTSKTSYSGNLLNILTTQSQLVARAKNNIFYESIGLGTSGNGYFGGNVGIGTTNPTDKLEISGGNLIVNRPSNKVDRNGINEFSAFEINNSFTTGQSGYVKVFYPSYNNLLFGADYDGHIGGVQPNIQFGQKNTPFLTVVNNGSNTGNVGIGTINPGTKLEVNGDILESSDNSVITIKDDNIGLVKKASDSGVWAVGSNYNHRFGKWSTPSLTGNISSGTFIEQMRINNNGNVGIGVTNPSKKLEVATNTSLGEFRLRPADGLYQDYRLDIVAAAADIGAVRMSIKDNVFLKTYGYYDLTGLSLGVAGYEDLFHLKDSGNVGIGTTTPDQRLTVKGKIHAEEVIVDLNVPVADYVFKPNYKLMPLPEVEQFVKTNSHLPEIPSAGEITKNGLSMGEMQNKLLQKVEELTLYMISQQKTIDQQQAQIKELNNKLSKLNKQ